MKKTISMAIVIDIRKESHEIISWYCEIMIQFSMRENLKNPSPKISGKQKSNLCCRSNQTYDTFYLNCCMLNHLIQFTMLEKGKSESRNISPMTQTIYVAKVVKVIKHFIWNVTFSFVFFFQFSMFETRKSGSRKNLWIRYNLIKLMKYLIRFLTSWLLFQFTMLGNMNSGSQEIAGMEKLIYVAKVIKLLNDFILFVVF